MRPTRPLRLALLTLGVQLAVPGASVAALPQSTKDPCLVNGRDAWGTLGVGFYKKLQGTLRWYGDFRGAAPGVAHTFCIDAHFWYAAPTYRYQVVSGVGLRPRDHLIAVGRRGVPEVR